MEKTQVYTIVVTYNGFKWVDNCFGSLTNSSFPVKVLAIDNGSVDGTPEFIRKRFPSVEVIVNEKNLGFGQANNIGIRKAYDAGTDYVFLLNQDAWVEKDTIEKLVEVAKKNSEFGIVSPVHLNGTGDALDFRFSKWVGPDFCPGLYSDIFIGTVKEVPYETRYVNAAAWLISRTCIETIGGFNPLFFHYGEDDDYLNRVRYHGLKIGIYPGTAIYHDREKREKPEAFKDLDLLFERRSMIKYCDPGNQKDIAEEVSALKLHLAKSFIKLNFGLFNKFLKEYKIMNGLKKRVQKAKKQSQARGLTYL